MRTVALGPPPAEFATTHRPAPLAGPRHGFDEVWKGEYHMAPMAHPFHSYLFQEVSSLLRPIAQRAGLISTAGSTSSSRSRRYERLGHSRLLADESAHLEAKINWPPFEPQPEPRTQH
jgi:hypothetical protein